jgi:hypothetical protein
MIGAIAWLVFVAILFVLGWHVRERRLAEERNARHDIDMRQEEPRREEGR